MPSGLSANTFTYPWAILLYSQAVIASSWATVEVSGWWRFSIGRWSWPPDPTPDKPLLHDNSSIKYRLKYMCLYVLMI